MEYRIISIPSTNPNEAIQTLNEELSNLKLSPNIGFIIFTPQYFGKHQSVMRFLKKRLKFETIAFFADAFGTRDGIFTNGMLLLLLRANFKIFKTGKGNLYRQLSQIAENLKEFDAALAIYPAVYFPSRLKFLTIFFRDRFYWKRFSSCSDEACKKSILSKYSDWIKRERIMIPVNTVLRVLGKAGIPIGSINLVPLEAKPGMPAIYHNFKPIAQNILVVAFKEVDFDFKDVFPERGNSFEETKKILSSYFALKEEVTVLKEGNVVAEVNGMPIREYIKEKFDEWIDESEFLEKLERGEISGVSPFGLALISKETFGVSVIGLASFPLNFYPYHLDLSQFFDSGVIIGEIFSENPEDFVKFDSLSMSAYKFLVYCVDSTTLLAYRGHVYSLFEYAVKTVNKDWVIVFAPSPSSINFVNSNRISEIENNLYFFGSGTSFVFGFLDS
ncbi:hypothetical protein [Geoglobus ahangari]